MKKYKVNEIFYSLQGEGYFTGTAAIFVRFSGCNLDCSFCDTLHKKGDMLTLNEIISLVSTYPARLVVLTGGEPTLQADDELIAELHRIGKVVAMETNGTNLPPKDTDWITLSPKDMFCPNATPVLQRADEIKVVYNGKSMRLYEDIACDHRYIQPCDTGIAGLNEDITQKAIQFIKDNPEWRLSLQTQKILKVR